MSRISSRVVGRVDSGEFRNIRRNNNVKYYYGIRLSSSLARMADWKVCLSVRLCGLVCALE
jgi:hypothetical protein